MYVTAEMIKAARDAYDKASGPDLNAWKIAIQAALSKLRAPVADDWQPTPENINKLPEPVRAYVHELVANSDPSGMVAENTLLRDQTKQLDAMIGRLKQALNSVGGCFEAANCEGLPEALEETNDERLKDLVERRLMYAYEYARDALASAPVAGEAQEPAKITFVNGDPASCGCTIRFSDGGGEYSNVHYVSLCGTHSGAHLLSKVIKTGELTRPQHEDLEGEICAALDPASSQATNAAPQASEADAQRRRRG